MSEPASTTREPMLRPDIPGDESAALQWAIENFRNNAHNLKDPDITKKRLAYNKQLLLGLGFVVKTIQRENALSIVIPKSTEQLHRMDQDELVGLIAEAREGGEAHEYLLAVAAALIDNNYSLPDPLKEFGDRIFTQPRSASTGPRAQTQLHARWCYCLGRGYDLYSMAIFRN